MGTWDCFARRTEELSCAVGAGLAIVSIMLADAFAGMSAGMIVFAVGMVGAVQAAVLAIAFSGFMGRSILKHVEKAAAKQANTAGR